MSSRKQGASVEQAHRRLEDLYEISKLFASFETVGQAIDPALGIVTRSLPLRSAVLIETEDDGTKMTVWPSEGQRPGQVRAVKEHAAAAYGYLIGAASTKSLNLSEQAGATALPREEGAEQDLAEGFIVIPLVVANHPPFGVLQLEGARPLDETDLMFVNAIANQLAIALDRVRAWGRDITRREHAEEGRTEAETLSVKHEALAAENARLYEQAQRAVLVREQILAIVSHDLRNPLGTILMNTRALAKRGALPEQVGRIQRAAERMLRLIEDLLDFASIEAGRLAIRRQPQDPGPMIQETLASFEGLAHEKNLQLTADAGPQLPKVHCDRDRILQVLSNLVGNATMATPEGGHITLRVEARGHEVLFAVSDDGPGIKEEDVKHLFERYWRSGDVEYSGTGLGLAIARGIVNAHGGRIWAESELGQGATFLFTVPTADVTSLFTAPAPDPASSAQGLPGAGPAKGT